MRILALETSGSSGSIALAESEQVVCEISLTDQQRMAQSLLPAIQQALQDAAWQVSDLQLICVTTGPGSFTGLRIGVTAAKMLAFCCDADIAGVNSLQAIAWRLLGQPASRDQASRAASIVAAMDAQRKQLFRAEFKLENELMLETTSTMIVDRTAFVEQLAERAFVTGPGLAKIREQLLAARVNVQLADEAQWQPSARDVARIGLAQFNAGQHDDKWRLVPRYFRKSAAEEKLDF